MKHGTAGAGLERILIIKGLIALVIVVAIAGWLVLRSGNTFWRTIETDQYTVKIPDGWTVAHFTGSDTVVDADCVSCIVYKTGHKAEVMTYEGSIDTKNRLSSFMLEPTMIDQDEEALFEGYQKAGIVLAKNASGNKYVRIATEPEDGHVAGPTIYKYSFRKGDSTIVISHAFGLGGEDRHEMVEKLIQTLELK